MADQKRKVAFWHPFQKLETEEQSREAAKLGASAAGLIGLGYAIALVAGLVFNVDLFGDGRDTAGANIGYAVGLALAAFLGWRIYVSQPVWAAILVLLWAIIETIVKVQMAAASGESGGFIVNAIALAVAALSLRGCLKLRSLRKARPA